MQIDKTNLSDSVVRLKLNGKLDFAGASAAEIPIGLAAKNSRALLIDMSGVSFVASVGVRHLVMAAKTLGGRDGRLVLFALTDSVEMILQTMGIQDLIPMVPSEQAALEIVGLAA